MVSRSITAYSSFNNINHLTFPTPKKTWNSVTKQQPFTQWQKKWNFRSQFLSFITIPYALCQPPVRRLPTNSIPGTRITFQHRQGIYQPAHRFFLSANSHLNLHLSAFSVQLHHFKVKTHSTGLILHSFMKKNSSKSIFSSVYPEIHHR